MVVMADTAAMAGTVAMGITGEELFLEVTEVMEVSEVTRTVIQDMDEAVTVVTTDTILVTEADTVQITARHIQQEVRTIIVAVLMPLLSVIQLVIVVILKHDFIHMLFCS